MSELVDVVAKRLSGSAPSSLIIGVGGGSGSGKSTIATMIAQGLNPLSVDVINQDRFFKQPDEMPTYHSAELDEDRPNFNHPNSFRRTEMIASCGGPTPPDVIIFEGILALHFAQLRDRMHLRCYVTVPLEVMLTRRTERNLADGYGGTREEIGWYNRECVSPYHRQFNAPTARYADVLIPNDDGDTAERDRTVDAICRAVLAVKGR